jgi:hypothetical protein
MVSGSHFLGIEQLLCAVAKLMIERFEFTSGCDGAMV